MVRANPNPWIARAGRIAVVGFGAWIVITSAIGIALGVHSGEGWLAILFGGLGVSMGAAGMAGVLMSGALRGVLLGWFLVGIASRALVEGDTYLIFISVPIAVALLAALAVELLHRRSVSTTVGTAAGGGLAILSLVALAIAAPSLPVICQPFPAPGTTSWFLSVGYVGNTPPFDVAEQKYNASCRIQNMRA